MQRTLLLCLLVCLGAAIKCDKDNAETCASPQETDEASMLQSQMSVEKKEKDEHKVADVKAKKKVLSDKITKKHQHKSTKKHQHKVSSSIAATTMTSDAYCSAQCSAAGYCCNDPSVGSNQMISCAQACKMRSQGAAATDLLVANGGLCNRNGGSGCSLAAYGTTYTFCQSCSDLKSSCPWGVQDSSACDFGAKLNPAGASPYCDPSKKPTVTLVSGSGLGPSYWYDTVDPFCHLQLGSTESTSPTVWNKPSPTWNFAMTASDYECGEDVLVTCFDNNKWTSNKKIGSVTVPISGGDATSDSYALSTQGKVTVSVSWS